MKKNVLVMMALMLVTSVFAASDLTFEDEALTLSVNPGDQFTYMYSVQNNGPDNMTAFTVKATALTDGSNQIFGAADDFVVSNGLADGEKTAIQQRPRAVAFNQKAGTYTSTLSINGCTGSCETQTLTVTVNPVPNSQLTADSPDLVQGFTKEMTITVQNTGNTDLNLLPSIQPFTDGTNNLAFSANPAGVLSVPHGQTKTLKLSFSVASVQPIGTYISTVTFTDGGYTSSALPLTVTVRAPKKEVTFSDMDFGSFERDELQTKTITVKNTGDLTLTNVQIASTIPAKYDPLLSASTVASLAPGASFTTQLSITAPEKEDSGQTSFGKLSVTADGSTIPLAQADVTGDVISHLEIDSVEVRVDGDKNTVSDGDTVDKVRPFSKVDVKVRVQNTFDVKNEIDVDTYDVNVLGIDDGDDIELEGDSFKVKDGKHEDKTLTFTVPETVDHEDEYDVEVIVSGEDDNGATHTATLNFVIQIYKEKHDFLFENTVTPATVTACSNTFTLDLGLTNLGRDDESDVVLDMTSDALKMNIHEEIGDMSSDWGDDTYKFQKFYTIPLPSNIKPGTYQVQQDAYVDEDNLEGRNDFSVTIGECEPETVPVTTPQQPTTPVVQQPTTPSNQNVEVVQQPATQQPATQQPTDLGSDVVAATPIDSSDQSSGTSMLYIVLLVVGNLAVIGILLVLIAKVLKKNN